MTALWKTWRVLLPVVAALPAAPGQVTFTKDIAPILQNRCQTCHRPNTFAPMSLLTYEEVRPWAKSIKERVLLREMPPWYIDKNVGIRRFKNDVSLSDEEMAAIAKWADSGAPQGNPADLPPPRHFEDADKWHIGQPDLIVQLPEDRVVPATAPDRWLDILVDPGLKEDRYMRAIETKPTKGAKVVHHVVTSMKNEDGSDPTDDAGDVVQGIFLNEYALGKNGDVFPEGAGRLIKAGTKINFNMHLHAIGQETRANAALGLKFYPQGYVPKYIETTRVTGETKELDIPPHTDNVRSDGYTTLTKPARVLSYQPHLHNRGKASCMEAIYPGGRKVEMLSCVGRYRFAWHLVYLYQEDEQPLLPAGTTLHVTSWHDNTTGNSYNPDPDALVTFGQRTIDEMGFAWVSYYYLSEDDYRQQLEARQAKRKLAKAE
jgi:cytochrome c553